MISFFQLHLMLNATSTPDKFSVQQKKKKLLHKKTSNSMLDRSVLCPNVRCHIIVRYIEVIKLFIDYFCQAYHAIMWIWLLIGTTVYTLLQFVHINILSGPGVHKPNPIISKLNVPKKNNHLNAVRICLGIMYKAYKQVAWYSILLPIVIKNVNNQVQTNSEAHIQRLRYSNLQDYSGTLAKTIPKIDLKWNALLAREVTRTGEMILKSEHPK